MLQGLGALAGWFDYDGECDMNEWQAREHIVERVSVPGFIRGRRWEAVDGHPRYFMLYETDDVDVFRSASYLERLNQPSAWSRRCADGLSNMTRSLCAVLASVGAIDGGSVLTAEIDPGRSTDAARRLLADALLPELVARPGVYAAHLLEADLTASGVQTEEKRLRGSQDRVVGWALVVEGQNHPALASGVEAVDAATRLASVGASLPTGTRTFTLSFSASAATVVAAR